MEGIAQASICKADRVSSMCMQDSEIINRGFQHMNSTSRRLAPHKLSNRATQSISVVSRNIETRQIMLLVT
jgi:hypothetical protein